MNKQAVWMVHAAFVDLQNFGGAWPHAVNTVRGQQAGAGTAPLRHFWCMPPRAWRDASTINQVLVFSG